MDEKYKVGDIVWSKTPELPWWPSRLDKIDKDSDGKLRLTVVYLGKDAIHELSEVSVVPYVKHYEEYAKTEDKGLRAAILRANEIKLASYFGDSQPSSTSPLTESNGADHHSHRSARPKNGSPRQRQRLRNANGRFRRKGTLQRKAIGKPNGEQNGHSPRDSGKPETAGKHETSKDVVQSASEDVDKEITQVDTGTDETTVRSEMQGKTPNSSNEYADPNSTNANGMINGMLPPKEDHNTGNVTTTMRTEGNEEAVHGVSEDLPANVKAAVEKTSNSRQPKRKCQETNTNGLPAHSERENKKRSHGNARRVKRNPNKALGLKHGLRKPFGRKHRPNHKIAGKRKGIKPPALPKELAAMLTAHKQREKEASDKENEDTDEYMTVYVPVMVPLSANLKAVYRTLRQSYPF